jgi:hypothetical protein
MPRESVDEDHNASNFFPQFIGDDEMNPYEYVGKTLWVLDTSYLLQHPYVMCEVPGTYVIPDTVLRKFDDLQQSSDQQTRETSRKIVRFIISLMESKNRPLLDGINWTSRSDTFVRHTRTFSLPDDFVFPKWLESNENDDRIIAAALYLTKMMCADEDDQGSSKGLATENDGMKLRAGAFGISVIDPYRFYATGHRARPYDEEVQPSLPSRRVFPMSQLGADTHLSFQKIKAHIREKLIGHHPRETPKRLLH